MYEHPEDTGKLDVKGIALVRGDSSSLTKRLQLEVINIIIKQPKAAWEPVKKLLNGAIKTVCSTDVKDLIKSRKLGENYKHPERQVQWRVAQKMLQRGESVPQVGERVCYLIGRGDGNISARADTPDNVVEIDYGYYINSQIMRPMERVLDVLCKNWKHEVSE